MRWVVKIFKDFNPNLINAQSASLRSLVAAESKAAEIKAAVACFESVCQLLTWTCLECVCQL